MYADKVGYNIYPTLYIKLYDNRIYNIEDVYEVSHTNCIIVYLVFYKKTSDPGFPCFCKPFFVYESSLSCAVMLFPALDKKPVGPVSSLVSHHAVHI